MDISASISIGSDRMYLAMIDVTNCTCRKSGGLPEQKRPLIHTNIHMRLVALKDSGI